MSAYNRFNTFESNRNTVLNFDQDDDHEIAARETLLRESGHLERSEQMLDEQYDIAVKSREELIHQRETIRSMQSRYASVTDKFQHVNTLLKKIGIRKRRDTIIVGVVFCICLFFLLYKVL